MILRLQVVRGSFFFHAVWLKKANDGKHSEVYQLFVPNVSKKIIKKKSTVEIICLLMSHILTKNVLPAIFFITILPFF